MVRAEVQDAEFGNVFSFVGVVFDVFHDSLDRDTFSVDIAWIGGRCPCRRALRRYDRCVPVIRCVSEGVDLQLAELFGRDGIVEPVQHQPTLDAALAVQYENYLLEFFVCENLGQSRICHPNVCCCVAQITLDDALENVEDDSASGVVLENSLRAKSYTRLFDASAPNGDQRARNGLTFDCVCHIRDVGKSLPGDRDSIEANGPCVVVSIFLNATLKEVNGTLSNQECENSSDSPDGNSVDKNPFFLLMLWLMTPDTVGMRHKQIFSSWTVDQAREPLIPKHKAHDVTEVGQRETENGQWEEGHQEAKLRKDENRMQEDSPQIWGCAGQFVQRARSHGKQREHSAEQARRDGPCKGDLHGQYQVVGHQEQWICRVRQRCRCLWHHRCWWCGWC